MGASGVGAWCGAGIPLYMVGRVVGGRVVGGRGVGASGAGRVMRGRVVWGRVVGLRRLLGTFGYEGACTSGNTSCIAIASQHRLTSLREQ